MCKNCPASWFQPGAGLASCNKSANGTIVLGEGITSAIEGVGLLVVALSSAGYLGRQVLARRAAG